MVCVPAMPSYYTFCVNTIGFVATTLACVFVIQFLNTRPTQQKNILNRILALSIIILLWWTTQRYIVSFLACFLTSEVTHLVNIYPLLTYFFFSVRNVVIAALCSMCCLSAGRLLLFTKPVIFISLNSYTGVMLTGFMTALGITADQLCRWLTCSGDQLKNHMSMKIFRASIGIQRDTFANQTINHQQNGTNKNSENIKNDNQCSDLPMLKIGAACFLVLEASKLLYTIAKELIKQRKESKIINAPDNTQEMVCPKIPLKQKSTRSESLPEISVLVIKKKRRKSLQILKISDCQITGTNSVITTGPTTKIIPKKNTGPRHPKKRLKGIVTQLCVRTSSLFTGFTIIGLIVLINASFSNDASVQLSVTAFVVTERMIMYTLVLLLCVFDIDIVMHFKEKFNFPNL